METTITLKIVFSVTFHLELHNAISINCISHIYEQMNLMAGPRCPVMHWFSHKARVDIKNGRSKAVKAALSVSRRPI